MSQVASIALLHVWTLRRLILPSNQGRESLSSPIGEDCCLSQMKLWVSFVRAMVMGLGMPWDFVRNLGHAAYCKLYDQGFGIEGWVSG